jgi:hypothetical protein
MRVILPVARCLVKFQMNSESSQRWTEPGAFKLLGKIDSMIFRINKDGTLFESVKLGLLSYCGVT